MPWQEIFSRQEDAWEAFQAALSSEQTSSSAPPRRVISHVENVPWPNLQLVGYQLVGEPNETASSSDYSRIRSMRRRAVKRMLLSWHPDKFFQVFQFSSSEVRAACEERVLDVCRRLTEL